MTGSADGGVPAPATSRSRIGTTALAWGVARVGDNPKAALVSFRTVPTDADLHLLHEALRPTSGNTIHAAAGVREGGNG